MNEQSSAERERQRNCREGNRIIYILYKVVERAYSYNEIRTRRDSFFAHSWERFKNTLKQNE